MFGPAANAQPHYPDLSGSYRCEGDQAACEKSGRVFSVSQSGADLRIKNDKGEIGTAKLNSEISLSAGPIWNMFGVIVSRDKSAIEWSNGTTWRKQAGSLTQAGDTANQKAQLTKQTQDISDFPLPERNLVIS